MLTLCVTASDPEHTSAETAGEATTPVEFPACDRNAVGPDSVNFGTLDAGPVAYAAGASLNRSPRRFSCVPTCGRRRSEVPLTVHPALRRGNVARAGSDVFR